MSESTPAATAPFGSAAPDAPLVLDEAQIARIVAGLQKAKSDPEIPRAILRRLVAPFKPGAIRWRPGTTKGEGGNARALSYVNARDVIDRLDDVLGMAWSNTFREMRGGRIVICEITIRLPDGSTVTRSNGSDDSDIEPEKGALSGAIRRAGTMFGVGRYLYGFPSPRVALNGKAIADTEKPKLLAEEQKFWKAWLAAEEKRKADVAAKRTARTSAQVPAAVAPAATAPTVEAPSAAAASAPADPKATAPQTGEQAIAAAVAHPRAPDLSAVCVECDGTVPPGEEHVCPVTAAILAMSAAASDAEVRKVVTGDAWKAHGKRKGFRAAFEQNMQRFTPGWTIAGAEKAAEAKKNGGGATTTPKAAPAKDGPGRQLPRVGAPLSDEDRLSAIDQGRA